MSIFSLLLGLSLAIQAGTISRPTVHIVEGSEEVQAVVNGTVTWQHWSDGVRVSTYVDPVSKRIAVSLPLEGIFILNRNGGLVRSIKYSSARDTGPTIVSWPYLVWSSNGFPWHSLYDRQEVEGNLKDQASVCLNIRTCRLAKLPGLKLTGFISAISGDTAVSFMPDFSEGFRTHQPSTRHKVSFIDLGTGKQISSWISVPKSRAEEMTTLFFSASTHEFKVHRTKFGLRVSLRGRPFLTLVTRTGGWDSRIVTARWPR